MTDDAPLVLLAGAQTRDELVDALRRYRALPPGELAGRLARQPPPSDGRHRVAIVAPASAIGVSLDLAVDRLPGVERPRFVSRAEGVYFSSDADPGRVAFLFPGQGSEHVGMLRGLRERMPVVGAWFDALDEAARALGEPPPTAMIDPRDRAEDGRTGREPVGDMARGAELGTIADLALYDVLSALGVGADVHVGHSNGEHPAVVAAGMVAATRDELCRGFVQLGLDGGRTARPRVAERLLAVSACDRETLVDLLRPHEGRLFVAMDNCPTQLVVGGHAEAADQLARRIVARGGIVATLPFTRAYHTPLFADWAAVFAAYYQGLRLGPGRVPVYSCLTIEPLPDDPDACRRAMADQWTAPVHFRATVEHLHDAGVRTFVEVGPDAKLTAFVGDTLRGRPHLAAGTSSLHRGEVEQLCHLLGELFVAGLAVDPRALAGLFAPGATTAWAYAADVHRRLAAEARASLARGAALAGQAAAVIERPARPGAWPLVGTALVETALRLETRRRFTCADDPFLDDHALGRRRADQAGHPLPVLPFTLSLAMAAEAARRLAGAPVTQIRDVRASRWLALDQGSLTVDVAATHGPGGVRVRLTEQPASVPGPAFEATVVTGERDPAVSLIDRDPSAVEPRGWSAESFYGRFAFHGPGFQGLRRVTAVGPRGIEAEVAITRNAGLAPDALALDPAMVDCAGQLVAFWLLEQIGRAPTFGIFPFAVRRVVIRRPPLPVATRLRCRGVITLDEAGTEASFVFETLDGEPILGLESLAQRLVELPEPLARRLFLGDPVALPAGEDWSVLAESWGIWERALAHLTLAPDDLETWRRMPASKGTRRAWLLARPEIREPVAE